MKTQWLINRKKGTIAMPESVYKNDIHKSFRDIMGCIEEESHWQ